MYQKTSFVLAQPSVSPVIIKTAVYNVRQSELEHHASTSAANPGSSAQEVDLTGDREFLTKESAKRALAPLLAEGSAVKRVGLLSGPNAGLLGLQIPASCHGEPLEYLG